MSDYLTNLIGQQRPRNTVPVPTATPAPKLLPNSLQDAGNELLGNLGIAGRGLVQGAVSPVTMVADPLTEFINKTFGAKQKLPSQAVSEGLTALGVPQAKDDAQRILEAATGGLAGGGAIAKTAQLAGKGAQALKGYLDTIGKDLAGQMTSGLGSGAGSVGASQAATASGASPVVAQLAGLGGGIVGGGARPVPHAHLSDKTFADVVGNETKVGDLFDLGEIGKKHPELKNIWVSVDKSGRADAPMAGYRQMDLKAGDPGEIMVDPSLSLKDSQSFTHELQHAIDQLKGEKDFGQTSSMMAWNNPKNRPILMAKAKQMLADEKPAPYEVYWGKTHTPEGDAAYKSYLDDFNSEAGIAKRFRGHQMAAPRKLYEESKGEARARLAAGQ